MSDTLLPVADSFRETFTMTMDEVDRIESNPMYPVATIQRVDQEWLVDDDGDAHLVTHDPPRIVAHPRTIEALRELVRRRDAERT